MKLNASLFFLCLSLQSFSKDILNTAMVDSAETLPENVFTFGVHYSQSSYKNEFNSQGKKTSLATLMNEKYSFNDIIEQERDAYRQVLTKGALQAYGINNLEDFAGEHTGNLQLESNAYSLFFGYGASKSFSFFAVLPIVELRVNFKNNFERSKNFEKLIQDLKKDGNFSQVKEIENKLSNPVRYQLEDYGYKPLYPKETKAIGDLRLLSRFNYKNTESTKNSLGIFLVLPTGKENEIDEFMDLYIGDGQWDIGLETLNSFRISDSLNYFFSTSYTYQAHKRSARRIPREKDKLISPDIDGSTKQKFGDILRIQNQINYTFNTEWNISLGYIFQYKGKDEISGKSFEKARYNFLENDTRQKVHALYAGLGFNSIDMFLKRTFLIPLNLSLTYSRSIHGENSLYNNEIALNLLSFYK